MPEPAALADTLIAESPAMREVLSAATRIARGSGGVLINGEPGTGRGLLSRFLHEAGGRRGAHVEVACDTPEPADADAALFGRVDPRERNGANGHSSSSRFERVWPGSALHRALDGTVCLRRIEDLPERVQAKLARVLRDGELVVGGSGRPQSHGIRAVAVADQGLDQYVRDGRVRQDLHKRLSSATLTVPPLRERRDDIPRLAELFACQACALASLPAKTFTPPTEQLLRALPWRGNGRELQAVVGAVVLQSADDAVDLDAVLAQLTLDAASAKSPTGLVHETLRTARARFEREYIAAVMVQHRGRIPDAAKSLGIQRTNLYRKLRSLRLQSQAGRRLSV